MNVNLRKPQRREIHSPAGADLHVAVWEGGVEERGSVQEGASGIRGILLVHGLASNARMWDGVAHYLAEFGHPVAAVDLRGHGLSSKPDQGYDFATMCVDLDYVLASLASANREAWSLPLVVGQSWGANVVVELGATRPLSISGLVCIDGGTIELSVPFPDWEACAAALAPPRISQMTPEDLDGHLRAAHPDWPESGIQGMLANFIVDAEGFVEPCLSFDHHMTILRHLWGHRPSLLYPSITVPVLLVPADNNSASMPVREKKRDVEAALAVLPNARARWFAGDHDVHAQYPREIAELIHSSATDGFFG